MLHYPDNVSCNVPGLLDSLRKFKTQQIRTPQATSKATTPKTVPQINAFSLSLKGFSGKTENKKILCVMRDNMKPSSNY